MKNEVDLMQFDIFKKAVETRLKVPMIISLYQKFERTGLEKISWEIINGLSEAERRPLLYTLTTHVTKEKPVFIYAIGKHCSQHFARTQFVAASTDLLWSLSLMMDDMIDNDVQRADKDTAWVIYGKKPVKEGMKVTFKRFVQEQSQRISPGVAIFLQECVDEGMRSLFAPQIHTLDSTEEDILRNIDQRARFHCEYPMRAIFEGSECLEKQAKLGTEALLTSNRAGQILNDVKDLVPSNLYGRPLFSDLVGGTTTIPLKMTVDAVQGADKKLLLGGFGKKELDPKTLSDLENLVLANLPRSRIFQKVSSAYEYFVDIMRQVTDADDFNICQEWVQYKISQADKLLLRT